MAQMASHKVCPDYLMLVSLEKVTFYGIYTMRYFNFTLRCGIGI